MLLYKYCNKAIYFLLTISIVTYFSGCDIQIGQSHDENTSRHKNIPKSAIWVGGLDGGVYVDIKPKSKSICHAKIFYKGGFIDYNGSLIINTLEKDFNCSDSNAYSSWDGDTLYLQDGRFLKVVE